ncbi:hypothetical protein BJ742DRAFT_839574 [Cladochytrium replicatum]|nr:hypothetical protein BJ742DRAFT_839574 [Cladochytrium replicatum]
MRSGSTYVLIKHLKKARRLLFATRSLSEMASVKRHNETSNWLEIEVGADLRPGQMRAVDLPQSLFGANDKGEPRSILLSRLADGSYHATGRRCTHYNAPLETGVLNPDGHVRCPWHGACFNVRTGDIEDSPGLDNLKKYTLSSRVANGKVYATLDASEIVEDRLHPSPACAGAGSTSAAPVVLIIGGGASGFAAAERLRELKFNGKVIILTKEAYFPIDRPLLSKMMGATAEKVALRKEPTYFTEREIDVRTSHEVVSVETAKKHVTVKTPSGQTVEFKYDHLVLATGSTARQLTTEFSNVVVLRDIADNEQISKVLGSIVDRKPNVVCIGGGFVGLEMAAVLSKSANVTVIGRNKFPLDNILGPIVGQFYTRLHEINGVKVVMNYKGNYKFEPSANDSSIATAVILTAPDGTESKIPADLVLTGIGASPTTSAFKPAFHTNDRDGSIPVDAYLRVLDSTDVWAAGDIARYPYAFEPASPPVRIEHWTVAMNHGRRVGENIVAVENARKEGREPSLNAYATVPFFWTNQHGRGLRYVGHPVGGYDEVVVIRDGEDGKPVVVGSFAELVGDGEERDEKVKSVKFVAVYGMNGKVVAIATVGKDPLASKVDELMQRDGGRKMPSMEAVKGGIDFLNDVQL